MSSSLNDLFEKVIHRQSNIKEYSTTHEHGSSREWNLLQFSRPLKITLTK